MERDLCDPIVRLFVDLWEKKTEQEYEHYLHDLQSCGDDYTGICSFSDSPLNLYLWDKYASGHRGFCLEFELTEGREPIEVKYKDNRPLRFRLDEVLRKPRLLWDSLSVKHKKFEAEKEFRIIEHHLEADPWDQGRVSRKFREFRLTTCILGVDFPVELVDIITAVLPPHVILEKARLDPYSSLTGKDGELHRLGFGSGPPRKYMAGRDRKILDNIRNPQQQVQVDPAEYENHGRDEGYVQIRCPQPIFRSFPERKKKT